MFKVEFNHTSLVWISPNDIIGCTAMICFVAEKPFVGMWRSLVAHLAWDEGVARSNRVIPTI